MTSYPCIFRQNNLLHQLVRRVPDSVLKYKLWPNINRACLYYQHINHYRRKIEIHQQTFFLSLFYLYICTCWYFKVDWHPRISFFINQIQESGTHIAAKYTHFSLARKNFYASYALAHNLPTNLNKIYFFVNELINASKMLFLVIHMNILNSNIYKCIKTYSETKGVVKILIYICQITIQFELTGLSLIITKLSEL